MENSNLSAFYRLLTTRIVIIFLLILMSVGSSLFLFWQSEQGSEQLTTTTLPFWQNQIEYQRVSSSAKALITKILSSEDPSQYISEHQKLTILYQDLVKLFPAQSTIFKELLNQQVKLEDTISRLHARSDVNQQLKADSLIQLQLMLSSLTKLTDQKQQQQQLLFKQITSDNVTDRVTANRAKAYALITQQLLNYNQLKPFISDLYSKIKLLNIKSSEDLLESIASLSEHLFLVYDELLPSNDEGGEGKKLHLQLINFEQLLLKKQNFLAKWRGQLRLSQQHRQMLSLWLQSLQTTELTFNNWVDETLKNQKKSSLNKPVVTALIQRYFPHFTQQYWVWTILAVISSGVLLTCIILLNLRRKIKHLNQHTVTLIQKAITGELSTEEIQGQIICIEEQEIVTAIEQLQQPEYSKQDYLDLQQSVMFQNSFLSENNRCCFWQCPAGENTNTNSNEQRKLWHQILANGGQQSSSWRRYFSKQACLNLINHAKIAKKKKTIQHFELETLQQQTVEITIEYKNKQWLGSLINVSTQAELEQELANLAIRFNEQFHQVMRHENNQHVDLNKLLAQVMLQAQSISIDSGITVAQLYRLLNRIKLRSKQTWLANEFLLQGENKALITPAEHSLVFTDVNFIEEIFCAVMNANFEASIQQNNIQLNFQHEILPLVKLDTALFQQLFSMLSALILEQQFKANLLVSLRLHDKNSGQQSIAFSFKLLVTAQTTQEQKNQFLAEQLKLLMLDQDKLTELTSSKILALRVLLARLLVTDVDVFENDDYLAIELILPLALSTEQQTIANVDLKQQHFLVISANEQVTTQLDEILKANHAFNHHLAKAEYFAKQYSVKQLTKQPITAIFLASDSFTTAIDIVSNHIDSLPNKLKPKLLVMQSLNQCAFERYSFYAFTENLITQQTFIEHLQTLMAGEAENNQLLISECFKKYRYQNTQVEVLVATKNILKQQHIIRFLTWLGMQVTVVSNSYSMLQYWQTGRYLVLLTEFEQSPLVELVTGKTVARGVFSLTEQYFTLPKELPDLAKNWQIAVITNILDLPQLTDTLKPWLKALTQNDGLGKVFEKTNIKANDKIKEKINTKTGHTKTSTSVIKEQNILDDVLNDGDLIFENQAFDLQVFARNQGSAELAAFMIEEYLQLIADHVSTLNTVLENQKSKLTQEARSSAEGILQQLKLIAKIMSAADFNESCEELEQSLTSSQASDIQFSMQKLAQQAQLLTLFAEAI